MNTIELTSDVTGKVWKVLVQAGAVVADGETVAIVECMKMEIPVTASQAGTVLRVCMQEGDSVEEGQCVIEITA